MPAIALNTSRLPNEIALDFWEIVETEEELLTLLPSRFSYAEEVALHFKSSKRREEWLAARVMLHRRYGETVKIDYLPTGRPVLSGLRRDNVAISISHTHGYVCLCTAPYPVGVDIEKWGQRAFNLKDRFLQSDEQKMVFASSNSEDELRQSAVEAWCAKEAAYKFFDIESTELLEGIHYVPSKDFGKVQHIGGDEALVFLCRLNPFALALCVPDSAHI